MRSAFIHFNHATGIYIHTLSDRSLIQVKAGRYSSGKIESFGNLTELGDFPSISSN